MFGRLTPMVKNLLLINLGVFLLDALVKLNLSYWLGLRVILSDQFQPHQFLTYMWVHGSFGHIFSNMFAVFIFGPLLEQVWGSKRFLTFYLICGIGAGVLYGIADFAESYPLERDTQAYVSDPNPEAFSIFIVKHKSRSFNMPALAELADKYYEEPDNPYYKNQTVDVANQMRDAKMGIPMVGASGAVFGILMAFAMLFPNMQLFLLFPPIPVRAKYLVFFYGLYELYSEFNRVEGDNVAHLAHLGGMLIAFILLKVWRNDTTRLY